MTGILVYVESRDGIVLPITHELLGAARQIAKTGLGEVICCVPSADAKVLVGQLKGADRILTVQHQSLSPYSPEAHGIAMQGAVEACLPDLVLLGYSSTGIDLGSSLSIIADMPLVAYCTAIEVTDGELLAKSQIYGGKLVAKTKTKLPAIAVVVPGSYDENSGKAGGRGEVVALPTPVALDLLRMRFVSAIVPDPGQIDLTKAERIVCVGRGIGSADKISVANTLASLLGAEVAGSRPVIDSGWLPKARQVGKSGQKVNPKLYIAAGISGAPEHLEGMKSADCIIAINSDAKAPIFEVAHVGTICDLFELLPALSERLGKG